MSSAAAQVVLLEMEGEMEVVLLWLPPHQNRAAPT